MPPSNVFPSTLSYTNSITAETAKAQVTGVTGWFNLTRSLSCLRQPAGRWFPPADFALSFTANRKPSLQTATGRCQKKTKIHTKRKEKEQKSRCWSVSEKKDHQAANKASVASVHVCFGCCQTRAVWEECLWTIECWISARGSFHGAAGDKRQTFYKSPHRLSCWDTKTPSAEFTLRNTSSDAQRCLAPAVWDIGVIIFLMGSWKVKLLNCCFHFFQIEDWLFLFNKLFNSSSSVCKARHYDRWTHQNAIVLSAFDNECFLHFLTDESA